MASDSISARPMIIAVWILAAAPGWRAIASTAEAIARPCPRAQSPAANAIAKPATRTANGPTRLPPAGASAASARLGNPNTNSPARTSERRTTALLLWIDLLVVLRRMLRVVLALLDGRRDVEHRQHHEDERLEERDQDLERVEEPDGESHHDDAADPADDDARGTAAERPADEAVEAHQEEDDGQQDMAARHVAEQTERE